MGSGSEERGEEDAAAPNAPERLRLTLPTLPELPRELVPPLRLRVCLFMRLAMSYAIKKDYDFSSVSNGEKNIRLFFAVLSFSNFP